jgi:hypothetical protein
MARLCSIFHADASIVQKHIVFVCNFSSVILLLCVFLSGDSRRWAKTMNLTHDFQPKKSIAKACFEAFFADTFA